MPKIAKLLAAVAPEVQITSRGAAPTLAATCARARSTKVAAAWPNSWLDAGLPNSPCAPRHCAMAAATRGSIGVVAAWSRYTGRLIFAAPCSCAGSHSSARTALLLPPLRRLTAPALHGAQYAAQDVELIAIELSAVEQSPQALHEVAGTVVKIDFAENLEQVRVKVLDIARRGQRRFELGARLRLLQRYEDFVGQKLHGHGQIQRAILGVGGDAHQHIAMIQVLRGEAVTLGAEQQCGSILVGQGDDAPRDIARRRELPVIGARTRRRAGDELGVAYGLGDGRDGARPAENVVRAGRQRIGLSMGKGARANQDQIGQGHVFHGSRTRADIARMAGIDEDDANESCHDSGILAPICSPS